MASRAAPFFRLDSVDRGRSAAGGDNSHADRDWLIVGAILTLVLGALTMALSPDLSGLSPALSLLPKWLFTAFAMAGVLVGAATIRMMRRRVERPLACWRRYFSSSRAKLRIFVAGLGLTGLNMIAFVWMKRLLNVLVPFWADPPLAWLDHAVFSIDPWRLFTWLANSPMAIIYHQGWFLLLVLTLVMVLSKPPCAPKTALLWTYFLLWSVFGPLIHLLMPAAGPVFYARLGYGDRFAGLALPPETHQLTEYLWRIYEGGAVGPVSGISAMPSMHIAMIAWMVIAVSALARRWIVPMSAAALLIFILSIALGWHYAVDGVAGAGGALLIWKASLVAVERIKRSSPLVAVPASPVA